MNVLKIYKYQLFLYLFIILFTMQNAAFLIYNSNFNGYKFIVKFVFALSVVVVFISVVLLVVQVIKTLNKKKIVWKEVLFLIVNIILYYLVVFSSLILSTQYPRSEEHTSELQSRPHLVCRLLLEKKKKKITKINIIKT